jgi:hypothetical protein
MVASAKGRRRLAAMPRHSRSAMESIAAIRAAVGYRVDWIDTAAV